MSLEPAIGPVKPPHIQFICDIMPSNRHDLAASRIAQKLDSVLYFKKESLIMRNKNLIHHYQTNVY